MDPRTVGVEEELVLVDPRSRLAAPRSDVVVGDHAARGYSSRASDDLSQELLLHQVETATEPETARDRLREQLVAARRTAGRAAQQHDLAVVACGTVPLPGPQREVTPKERYEDLMARFGDVARTAGTCGMHVHVGIADDEEGVAVIDGIGLWLPLLLAVSVNSPYAEGRDTGYASWRAQVWSRWPTAGATETFGSASRYHEVVTRLVALGAARDPSNVYFDVRLAVDQPTVELRVADVCTDVDDALLVAALGRALVDTVWTGLASSSPGWALVARRCSGGRVRAWARSKPSWTTWWPAPMRPGRTPRLSPRGRAARPRRCRRPADCPA